MDGDGGINRWMDRKIDRWTCRFSSFPDSPPHMSTLRVTCFTMSSVVAEDLSQMQETALNGWGLWVKPA